MSPRETSSPGPNTASLTAVYVSGTTADINVPSGTMNVTGQGFANPGAVAPTVALSDLNINVGVVTFNSSTSLTVAISNAGGWAPGNTNVTVTNAAAAGGFSGAALMVTTVPVELQSFTVE